MKPLTLEEAIVAEIRESLMVDDRGRPLLDWDAGFNQAMRFAESIIRKHIAALKVEDVQKLIRDNFPLALSEQSRIAAQSIMSLIRSE